MFSGRIHPDNIAGFKAALAVVIAATLLALVIVYQGAGTRWLWFSDYHLPVHNLFEISAVAISIMVFAVIWSNRNVHGKFVSLSTGACFFGVALLDFSHLLSFPGMPDYITPSSFEKSINFWLSARALAAIGLLGMALGDPHQGSRKTGIVALVGVITGVALLHYWFLFQPQSVPRTFLSDGGLTRFKVSAEFVLMVVNLVAAWLFYQQLKVKGSQAATGLWAASILTCLSEVFFTLYGEASDVYITAGHVYKLMAYVFVYRVLFLGIVKRPIKLLEESERQLAATLDALPDVLFEVSESGEIEQVHAGRPTLVLSRAEDYLGKHISEIFNARIVEVANQAIDEARVNGSAKGFRVSVDLDDMVRHFELTVSKLSYGKKGSNRYLVLSRDVTSVVEYQEALKLEAELNEGLLQISQHSQFYDEHELFDFMADHARKISQSPVALALLSARNKVYQRSGNGDYVPESLQLALMERMVSIPSPVILNTANECDAYFGQSMAMERMIILPVSESGPEENRTNFLFCVANKGEEYNNSELKALKILVDSIWQYALRSRQRSLIQTLSAALEQSPNSVLITGLDGKIEFANDAFLASTGYERSEVIGAQPNLVNSGKNPDEVYKEMWEKLRSGSKWQGELINRRKNGEDIHERVLIYPVRDKSGKVARYISHKENIAALKEADARIRQLSHYDQLTQLPNHLVLNERFNREVTSKNNNGHSFAVAMLDIDNFRAINDAMGQATGDEILIEMALRLSNVLPSTDLVTRRSGDSFSIILEHTDQQKITVKLQQIHEACQAPFVVGGKEYSVTVSTGVALYPNDGQNLDDLLAHAESAMYEVKHKGRNDFRFFAPEMQRDTLRFLDISNALKHALEEGEFHLAYQPQYDIQQGRMVAAEVLLRWQSERLGTVSPAEFIPVAESSGLIIPISEWVISTAAGQLKNWCNNGLDGLKLAINLSAVQFRQENLHDSLVELVREQGISPDQIELELTEAVALQDPEKVSETMNRLREQGFHLSIDDFGTGFSSMSYLKRFSVEKLKIDQSFVADITHDKSDLSITKAIVEMAHGLGMTAIAEGVETVEQLKLLQDMGCDEIQGYFYSRPLTADDFGRFIHSPNMITH